MERFNIVIVGHIDHGKSTLIGRLLYDTRSLPEGKMEEIIATCKGLGREFEFAYILDAFLEEREKAMTIDTAQVSFRTAKREYVIIDTPGHKELLRNMVTGASYAEGAILIVSASEGIQEQTKRHTYILKLLGIKQIIVIINKMDEVSYSQNIFNSLRKELKNLFSYFGIQMLCVIPISAKQGDNIAVLSKEMLWYLEETVLAALDSCKKIISRHRFRMPVQDIYRIDDEDVIVGTVSSGEIRENDKITVLPGNRKAGLKSIAVFEGKKDKASIGESIGLILEEGYSLKRGDILCAQSLPNVGNKFFAVVLCLNKKLYSNTPYILQCATQEVGCSIKKVQEQIDINTLENIPADSLSEAEVGRVEIGTDTPLVYEEFEKLPELGRFVLRESNDIIAAGIIV